MGAQQKPKKFPQQNYHEILKQVAEKTGAKKSTVYDVYNSIVETIVEELESGKSVKLPRLATFELVSVQAQTRRSPYNGETFEDKAKTVVKVRNKKNLIEIRDKVEPQFED